MFMVFNPINPKEAAVRKKISRFSCIFFALLCAGLLMTACSGNNGGNTTAGTVQPVAVRNYQATAAAGDFIKVTLDPNNSTYNYQNITTGQTESGTYSEQTDGYMIFTPQGGAVSNIVTAFESKDLALVMVAKNTGATADQTTIVFGLPEADIVVPDLTNKTESYNLLQFRTGASGFEFGQANLAGSKLSSVSYGYRYNAVEGLEDEGMSLTPENLQLSADGKYLVLTMEENDPAAPLSTNYIFKTPTDGVLAVDTPNGNILLLKTLATKEFQSEWAGTYNAVYYSGAGDFNGTAVNDGLGVGRARLNIAADGKFSIDLVDQDGGLSRVLDNQQFIPMADAKGNLLRLNHQTPLTTWAWDNNGAFYWQNPVTKQEIFAVFQNSTVFFASLTVTSEMQEMANGLPRVDTFGYFYGAGLKAE